MVPQLSWKIYLVVFALRVIDARAVNNGIAPLSTSDVSPSALTESSINTISSQTTCNDIKTCRTLDQIIGSCLVTILACVWFAVHGNVPAPKQEPSHHPNIFVKRVQRARSVILDQREAAIIISVGLIAPECILAWAVRQATTAWSGTLEDAKKAAAQEKEERRSTIVGPEKNEGMSETSVDGHLGVNASPGADMTSDDSDLLKRLCQGC